MAKETLLEIVQDILSDADGDEVTDISATIESDQCARVVRTCFNNIVDGTDLSHPRTLKQLDATSSSTPAMMTRPEGFHEIEWIKYDSKTDASDPQDYKEIDYKDPKDFIEMTSMRNLDDAEVEAMTLDSGHAVLIRNDIAPRYWTILENYDNIVFDAYDSNLETNLQASKSLSYGAQKPTLSLTSSSTPDLPKNLFNRLKNDARAMYFDLYKDGVTSEIDRLRRRSEVRSQRHRHVTKLAERAQTRPDYGRKPRGR